MKEDLDKMKAERDKVKEERDRFRGQAEEFESTMKEVGWFPDEGQRNSLWRRDMEMLSPLLALREGNPPVTGGHEGPITLVFSLVLV